MTNKIKLNLVSNILCNLFVVKDENVFPDFPSTTRDNLIHVIIDCVHHSNGYCLTIMRIKTNSEVVSQYFSDPFLRSFS